MENNETYIYDTFYRRVHEIAVHIGIISPLYVLLPRGIVANNAFGDFLTEGIYDPRLLITIERMIPVIPPQITDRNGMMLNMLFYYFIKPHDNNKAFVLGLFKFSRLFLERAIFGNSNLITNEIMELIAFHYIKLDYVPRNVTDIIPALKIDANYAQLWEKSLKDIHYNALFEQHGFYSNDFSTVLYEKYMEYVSETKTTIRIHCSIPYMPRELIKLSRTNKISASTLSCLSDYIEADFENPLDHKCRCCNGCEINMGCLNNINLISVERLGFSRLTYVHIRNKPRLAACYINLWNQLIQNDKDTFVPHFITKLYCIYCPSSDINIKYEKKYIQDMIIEDGQIAIHKNPRINELANTHNLYKIMKELSDDVNVHGLYPIVTATIANTTMHLDITYKDLFECAERRKIHRAIIDGFDVIAKIYAYGARSVFNSDYIDIPEHDYIYVAYIVSMRERPCDVLAAIVDVYIRIDSQKYEQQILQIAEVIGDCLAHEDNVCRFIESLNGICTYTLKDRAIIKKMRNIIFHFTSEK